MTVGELASAVYAKHCKGQRGFPAGWLAWVMWARRSTGWMQPMVPKHMQKS
jgi:hypothetical protein